MASFPLHKCPPGLHGAQHRIQLIAHRVLHQCFRQIFCHLYGQPIQIHQRTRAQPIDHLAARQLLLNGLLATFIAFVTALADQAACNKGRIALDYDAVNGRWAAGKDAHT